MVRRCCHLNAGIQAVNVGVKHMQEYGREKDKEVQSLLHQLHRSGLCEAELRADPRLSVREMPEFHSRVPAGTVNHQHLSTFIRNQPQSE